MRSVDGLGGRVAESRNVDPARLVGAHFVMLTAELDAEVGKWVVRAGNDARSERRNGWVALGVGWEGFEISVAATKPRHHSLASMELDEDHSVHRC